MLRRMLRSVLSAPGVISLIALAFAVGGFAWASIPAPNGVIWGCYNSQTGALRVIDNAKVPPRHVPCPPGEVNLNWHQGGLQGVHTVTAMEGPSAGESKTVTAHCPAGESATGGGFWYQGLRRPQVSRPTGAPAPNTGLPTGWQASVVGSPTSTSKWRLIVYAVCARR